MHGARLATLNVKDFAGVRNLELLDFKKYSNL